MWHLELFDLGLCPHTSIFESFSRKRFLQWPELSCVTIWQNVFRMPYVLNLSLPLLQYPFWHGGCQFAQTGHKGVDLTLVMSVCHLYGKVTSPLLSQPPGRRGMSAVLLQVETKRGLSIFSLSLAFKQKFPLKPTLMSVRWGMYSIALSRRPWGNNPLLLDFWDSLYFSGRSSASQMWVLWELQAFCHHSDSF